MLIVVSPAKTLDYATPPPTRHFTLPSLLDESARLIDTLRPYSPDALAELMKLSMKLAELNVQRYHDFSLPFTPENAKQALFAFQGDVYQGLEAGSLDAEGLAFAQGHLRMLSGLYGVLRPLDLMQPYRLEMGTRLQNPRGSNLYQFWGEIITARLNAELEQMDEAPVLVNLASEEYFKSVQPAKLAGRLVTPIFKEQKGDSYKVIGVHAKRARGMMSRYAIDQRITDVEALQGFTAGGYRFDPQRSNADEWVFIR